jgi:RNA polymerase sigma-70 factor (ECF subfamily)
MTDGGRYRGERLGSVEPRADGESQPDGGHGTGGRSDEELMLAHCRGSRDGFDELFGRYRQPLFGFFRRRLADAARAEELTQDTFVAVLNGAAKWEPTALFRTYLYAIGLKILSAERRKTAFRATFLGTAVSEPAARDSLDADVVMRDAVGRLERMDREVLLLREFEQMSYAEIAELLRLPVNTVRSRLFRARTALREVLTAPAAKAATATMTESEGRV